MKTRVLKTRVLLADDHKLFREALRHMLERHPDIEVVGEAVDGIQAVELVRSLEPDIAVIDLRMPRLNGLAAIGQLLAALPSIRVIAVSANSARIFASELLAAGARGYVTKSDAAELPQAIRAVMSNREYLSVEVAAPAVPLGRARHPAGRPR